jgi:hypothetical protein
MGLLLRAPGERESLPTQLSDLGRTRKRVAMTGGVCAFVAAVVGLVTLACFLDAAIHLSPLVRGFALVVILAVAGVVWVRGISRAARLRTDSLSIALELEDTFPTFNDSLASAVSFLGTSEDDANNDLPRKPTGVSNRLTASAVRVAERRADRLPIDSIIPYGRCWRAVWLCLLALLFAVPLTLWNTTRAATAVARLADPFGAHPWPTKTRIEFLAPTEFPSRIPKGEAFELRFAVRGVLSGPAVVTVRVKDGGEFEEQFPLSLNNDPKHPGAAVVTTRFDAARISSNFEVRLTANDAATEWLAVTVVPPPRLVPLNGRPSPQFHVTPPAYTKLPAAQLPEGAARIEVPTGTLVQFRAATDVRLSNAVLSFHGDKSALTTATPLAHLGNFDAFTAIGAQQLADMFTADIPLAVSGDGTRISGTFVPLLSGSYALKLTDETGLTGTRLIEITLTPDPAPKVTLARPAPGRDPSYLAPSASILVNATAEDAVYGCRSLFLEYRVGRDGAIRTIPLATSGGVSIPALAGVVGGSAFASVVPEGNIEVTRRIPISAFLRDDGSPLREGDLVIIRAAANDWDDVAVLKDIGRSAEVELRIASPEAIEAWLQKELATLRPELIRIRDQQREAKQKVTEIRPLPGGTLSPQDRDRVMGAEQTQRQVTGRITDPAQGIRAKADLLRETARDNNLPKSNTTDRIEIVALELARLTERDLGPAQQNLADALRLAGQTPQPGQEQQLADYLRKTGRSQKSIEDSATALLDLLSLWGGAGEIRGEARVQKDNILRQLTANEQLKDRVKEGKVNPADDEQRELDRAAAKAEQAAEQAGLLISRAAKLAAEKDKQADDLRKQAAKQEQEANDYKKQAANATDPMRKAELAAQAEALAAGAADLKAAADKADAEAKALRKGIDAAGGQGLPDELRKAGQLLQKNQQGEAANALRSSAGRLDALAEALAEKEGDTVPELAKPKNLKRTADQLDALAAAQDSLRKRVEAASRITDPAQRAETLKSLGQEQDKLIERGRELLQKLTAEKSDDAARDTRTALDKMEAARDDLENGKPNTRAQRDAVERLDTARDQLDNAAAQGGRQLSDEKRRKLADQVKALLERQRAALAETNRIHGEVAKQKGWDKILLTSYSDIDTVREEAIAVELRKLAETEFASLPVLARLLTDSASAIDTARAKIKARCDDADLAAAYDAELETANDRKVIRPMTLALRRLEQLADALKPDEPKQTPKKDNGDKQPNPPKNTNQQPNPNGGGEQDVIPPLAQLKVLRALQAELNERTAQFAKDHPDTDKLTDAEKEELKELEQAQREIAELFEQMAKLFQQAEANKEKANDPKTDMPQNKEPEKP